MNRPLLLEKLDAILEVTAAIDRTRRAAVNHLCGDKPALAAASVDLMRHYVEALVVHTLNAVTAAGGVSVRKGVLSCEE